MSSAEGPGIDENEPVGGPASMEEPGDLPLPSDEPADAVEPVGAAAPVEVTETAAPAEVAAPVETPAAAPVSPAPASAEAAPAAPEAAAPVSPAPAAPEAAPAAPEAAVPEAAVPGPAASPAPAIGDSAPASGGLPPKPAGPPPKLSPGEAPVAPPTDAGRILGGLITAISSEEVELTLDDGRLAVINRRNFDDDNTDPTTVYSVGDRAEGAVLVREDPKQRVVLSRSWGLKKKAWDDMAALSESGGTITATVTSLAKRGVVVDVGLRGFVPASHLTLEPPSDLSPFVGQSLEFKVLEIDPAKERLVLSRRSLLLKQQRKMVHDVLTGLTVGEVRTGTVASLVDYGAFVDLGGVTGLVHLSELSWKRIRRPADAVKVGDEVQVKVLDVKVKKRRVSLSIRQLTEDPLDAIPVGEIVTGPVTRLVDFGAFVDIGQGEGLVHLSELSEYRVFTPEEVVTPGEEVRVKVLSVDKKRRRIELSIRQAVSSDFG